jgi:hypothetical protein
MKRGGCPRPLPLLPSHSLMIALRNTSALFYLLDTQCIAVQRKLVWVRSYEEYMLARFSDPTSAASLAAQEVLQQFVRICKEHHVSVGFVLFSDVYFSETPFDFQVERALRVCQQEAIRCIDLRSTLVRYKGGSNRLGKPVTSASGVVSSPFGCGSANEHLWASMAAKIKAVAAGGAHTKRVLSRRQ